jgi:hypothetical protein
MKKNKFNPELLNEELKRFKLLENYSFYVGEDYDKPLILGDDNIDEADEAPEAAVDDIASDLGVGNEEPNAQPAEEIPVAPEEEMPAEEIPVAPEEEMPVDEPMPGEEDVEIDVTSLVKSTDEAKEAADNANKNAEMLLQKFSELEAKLQRVDDVSAKIENLEQEIVKRNPTPVEKLEMRSLDSFPYNQKLSDYWGEKHKNYETGDEKKEYVLTKDDVDSEYSYSQIKDSFKTPTDYEEEDV